MGTNGSAGAVHSQMALLLLGGVWTVFGSSLLLSGRLFGRRVHGVGPVFCGRPKAYGFFLLLLGAAVGHIASAGYAPAALVVVGAVVAGQLLKARNRPDNIMVPAWVMAAELLVALAALALDGLDFAGVAW